MWQRSGLALPGEGSANKMCQLQTSTWAQHTVSHSALGRLQINANVCHQHRFLSMGESLCTMEDSGTLRSNHRWHLSSGADCVSDPHCSEHMEVSLCYQTGPEPCVVCSPSRAVKVLSTGAALQNLSVLSQLTNGDGKKCISPPSSELTISKCLLCSLLLKSTSRAK